jgi:hypothetical protein
MVTHGEIRWSPMGRSDGHPWGLSMAAYGEIPMAAVTSASGRETSIVRTLADTAALG